MSTGHGPIGSRLAPVFLLGDKGFTKHQKQSQHLLLLRGGGGVEVSNVQSQDWDQPDQWIEHNQGLRKNVW